MDYKIAYDERVEKQLEAIYNYILEHFHSQQAAKKKIGEIVQQLALLKVFPEAGFDADERFGQAIHPVFKTRGFPLKKDYLALYTIDQDKKMILISYLLPTRSDYMKLFKR